MTKCSHDKCVNEAEPGSPYCKDCIQLPTKECNYCNLGGVEPGEMRKLADEISKKTGRSRKMNPVTGLVITGLFVSVGIVIGLFAIAVAGLWHDFGWLGISCGGMGGLFTALALMTRMKWI